jgi:hypothetical protein
LRCAVAEKPEEPPRVSRCNLRNDIRSIFRRLDLRLECVDKNAQSQNNFLGIHSVQLHERRPRVEKYGFDKEIDWRKNRPLYTK